ncbi:MAG: DUF5940 domain-containing protein, partial [Actinomycetota bacterium]
MSENDPLITSSTQILAHAPGLARHGSKPSRELPRSEDVESKFLKSLRSFDEAAAYLPHRAYLGALHPRDLPDRPWTARTDGDKDRFMADGEIMPEEEFYGLMACVDEFGLIGLDPDFAERSANAIAAHPLAKQFDMERFDRAVGSTESDLLRDDTLELVLPDRQRAGVIRPGHEQDASLEAHVMLENLACKATASLALWRLLNAGDIDPESIDYVISCSEEAIGDRYQRGGGNMAKAVAFVSGLTQASGCDVKNFCAAPIPALVIAGSLVTAGVFQRIAVIAGGSVAKMGMKFQGHLKNDLPVLEDVVGGWAAIVERKGSGAVIRFDAVGRHRVAHGAANPQIMQALSVEPLKSAGLKMTDVDDYGTELHNPEITEPQGSGNVPDRNYKTLAALAARAGDIAK